MKLGDRVLVPYVLDLGLQSPALQNKQTKKIKTKVQSLGMVTVLYLRNSHPVPIKNISHLQVGRDQNEFI